MLLIVASFSSSYREDDHILGIFSDEKKAEEAIQFEINLDKESHPNYPSRYQQKRSYYHTEEFEVDIRGNN